MSTRAPGVTVRHMPNLETSKRQGSHPDSREPQAVVGEAAPFRRLLCAVDGTLDSNAALRMAVSLTPPGGQLTLLAVTAQRGTGAHVSAAISPRRAESLLEQGRRIAAETGGVMAITLVDPGVSPEKVILEHASEHDLLVMGAPNLSWVGGLLVVGVATYASRKFTTPTLFVRHPFKGSLADRQILVASDGEEHSDQVVELAGRLARSQHARIGLVHALSRESQRHPARIQAQAKALELTPSAGPARIESGRAPEAIIAAVADTKASLVVLGSRHLGGLRVLGSVSRRVLHGVPCSVLLVPVD